MSLHHSYCQRCIQQARLAGRPVVMLTGYCLMNHCDRCGRWTDLAMIRIERLGPLEGAS